MDQKSYNGSNALYLIPTPIGNMEDITYRALNTLKMVDFLLCEDTRVTGQLLKHFNISKKMIRCEDHNEAEIIDYVLEELAQGKNIGLVTDRGTPIISDPGYKVVKEVITRNYSVISLPGATAFVPALTVSGLEPSPFLFYGFFQSKSSKRRKEMENLKNLSYTMIFYEAPHRMKDTLIDLQNVFGDRYICLCREISKLYEEIYRGKISDILPKVDTMKGEMVLVVEGNKEQIDFSSISIPEHVKLYTVDGLSEMEAIKKVAKERKVSKSIIYKEYHNKEEKR